MTPNGRCESCGVQAPTVQVSYWQNTGLLVARRTQSVSGELCKSCSGRVFWKFTLHNLFFGWWGMISILVTPVFIAMNIYYGIRSFMLPSVASHVQSSLEDQREYALALLKTKDDATVIEVLMKVTGLPEPEVAPFIGKLRSELADSQ